MCSDRIQFIPRNPNFMAKDSIPKRDWHYSFLAHAHQTGTRFLEILENPANTFVASHASP